MAHFKKEHLVALIQTPPRRNVTLGHFQLRQDRQGSFKKKKKKSVKNVSGFPNYKVFFFFLKKYFVKLVYKKIKYAKKFSKNNEKPSYYMVVNKMKSLF